MIQSRIERALLESEQKYRQLDEVLHEIIWVSDVHLNINFISSSVVKLTGFSIKEIVGNKITDFLTDFSQQLIISLVNTISESNAKSQGKVEVEFICRNTNIILLDISGELLKDTNNKPIGYLFVSHDITSKSKTHETINILTQAIEQSPVSVVITNTKGEIEYVNPKFIDITGYTFDEVSGENPRILKSGETSDDEYKKIWETITAGEIWRGEFHNKKKSGELYWEQATISPVRDTHGEIAHYIAIKEDVTKVKESHMQLLQSEEKFRQLAENLSQVFWLYEIDNGKLLYISPAFVELWGIPVQKIYEDFSVFTQAIHFHDRQRVIDAQIRLVTNNEVLAEEFRVMQPNGSIRWVWMRVYPVADQSGITYRIAGIAEDITLRKQVEADLRSAITKAEESDKLKSAFLANISHEIRTPMNGIIGFTELMSREDANFEKRQYYADIITKSTTQLLAVVDDILDLARIETGQLNIVKVNSNLKNIVSDVVAEFKPQLQFKGIEIIEEYLIDENKIVYTDKNRVKQILLKLLSNATKFTTKGHVKIAITVNPGMVVCMVEDTGIGIQENKKHLIFGRFQQADFDHSRLYGGVGLGLAISKNLIELLGGTMWFQSTEGVGSAFYFSLPDTELTLNQEVKPMFLESEESKMVSILVAEDENLNYLLIEDIFENTNVNLLHAHDGAEAVELCQKHSEINLVLMDIKMPIMNGIDATIKIKEFRPLLPIIAITAFFTDEDKSIAFTAGCAEYIIKPIKIDNFFRTVGKYVAVKINTTDLL